MASESSSEDETPQADVEFINDSLGLYRETVPKQSSPEGYVWQYDTPVPTSPTDLTRNWFSDDRMVTLVFSNGVTRYFPREALINEFRYFSRCLSGEFEENKEGKVVFESLDDVDFGTIISWRLSGSMAIYTDETTTEAKDLLSVILSTAAAADYLGLYGCESYYTALAGWIRHLLTRNRLLLQNKHVRFLARHKFDQIWEALAMAAVRPTLEVWYETHVPSQGALWRREQRWRAIVRHYQALTEDHPPYARAVMVQINATLRAAHRQESAKLTDNVVVHGNQKVIDKVDIVTYQDPLILPDEEEEVLTASYFTI